jgi:hypothetical protein
MKKIFLVGIVFGLLLIALLSGCGSGGGGGATSPITVALESQAPMDGVVHDSGSSSNIDIIWIGDSTTNKANRGIVSFSLNSIPPSADIQTAILRIYQDNNDPINGYSLGSVKVDHITFVTFDDLLYDQTALSTISGFLSTSFLVGWKEITVTAAVQNDLDNSRANSQYRFYHQLLTNNNNAEDSDPWYMGGHATLKPQLVITYKK